ncbi:hypothetical protein DQ04_04991010 [Trypanosoma grayi]|uniref:hypothetical protein n=1 Tax=Trypanosoma grayi TaxID=71804 RepID=UPI0004F46475|nr:hypothetical protein DQ04_04991010 [Trypanosoma grayi]KEG09582.1 hypothetical protein DQ04_04991010 [Trypanosoma grayi]
MLAPVAAGRASFWRYTLRRVGRRRKEKKEIDKRSCGANMEKEKPPQKKTDTAVRKTNSVQVPAPYILLKCFASALFLLFPCRFRCPHAGLRKGRETQTGKTDETKLVE